MPNIAPGKLALALKTMVGTLSMGQVYGRGIGGR